MNAVTTSLLFAIMLALVGVAGDFFIKMATVGKGYIAVRWFIAGLVIYAMTAFGWFYVMKHVKLATLGIFYAVTTVLALVLVGIFYFREPLNGYEALGIGLAIISLVLLGRFA